MDITKDTIKINDETYIILEKLDIDNITYLLLSNEHNKEDFFIQKLAENNIDIVPLSNQEEIDKVLSIYKEKYK